MTGLLIEETTRRATAARRKTVARWKMRDMMRSGSTSPTTFIVWIDDRHSTWCRETQHSRTLRRKAVPELESRT